MELEKNAFRMEDMKLAPDLILATQRQVAQGLQFQEQSL